MRLTESMSAELRDEGINVNAVLPSIIDTPANRQSMPERRPDRAGRAARRARAVIGFLASDDATRGPRRADSGHRPRLNQETSMLKIDRIHHVAYRLPRREGNRALVPEDAEDGLRPRNCRRPCAVDQGARPLHAHLPGRRRRQRSRPSSSCRRNPRWGRDPNTPVWVQHIASR